MSGGASGASGENWTAPEAFFRDRAFRLEAPSELSCAAVFSSPHSGRAYFSEFVRSSRLDLQRLRASEDAFVDELFDAAPRLGAPLLSAIAPRAFVDLNRCPSDLDPMLVEGAPKGAANARVAAGLGVVPRIVAEGVPIYARKLAMAEVERRVSVWHEPYHRALVSQLIAARKRFGWALLLDCHSMPSTSLVGGARRGAAEVILGDRFGISAAPRLVCEIEAAFAAEGFRVARNAPFAGGYITERYGRPAADVHAVQIEIDRGLYLDEARVARNDAFHDVRARMTSVITRICAMAATGSDQAEAAE